MKNHYLVANALLKTNPALYLAVDGGNSWVQSIKKKGARVRLYREYERGDHRADITDQMRAMLRLKQDDSGLNEFNDNYCRIVVDKMAGRLEVSEITTSNEGMDANWLAPLLKRNDFKAAQGMWFRGGVRDADSFVLVDAETGLWLNEPAFDGFSGMVVIYDQLTRKPIWACKVWSEADTVDKTEEDEGKATGALATMRLIVYQAGKMSAGEVVERGKISYWRGQEGASEVTPQPVSTARDILIDQPALTPSDGEPAQQVVNWSEWPPELTGRLPIVAFANQRDSYTRYGESELRPAIPLNDAVNRTLHSMVMASELAAFKLGWSIGFEIDPSHVVPGGFVNLVLKDENGKIITDMTEGQVAFMNAVRVGQFEPTDLNQYIAELKALVQEISQMCQTPIYGVTVAGAISGEALKQLEIGLIGKVVRFQNENTDAIEELIILTAQMERIYHPDWKTPDVTTVSVVWKPAELLDTAAQIALLTDMKQKTGTLWPDQFYRDRMGALLGLSKDEVKKYSDLAEEEKQKAADQALKIAAGQNQSKNPNQTQNAASPPDGAAKTGE